MRLQILTYVFITNLPAHKVRLRLFSIIQSVNQSYKFEKKIVVIKDYTHVQ